MHLAKKNVAADVRRDPKGSVVRVAAVWPGESVRLLGTSLEEDIKRMRTHQESFTLFVPTGRMGIVAIELITGGSDKKRDVIRTFVELDQTNSVPLDFDTHWIPSYDRPGGIDEHGNVWVKIGDTVFTSYITLTVGEARVDDANLLCRYLYGDVDEGVVLAAAAEVVAEKSRATRIIELEALCESRQHVIDTSVPASDWQMLTEILKMESANLQASRQVVDYLHTALQNMKPWSREKRNQV